MSRAPLGLRADSYGSRGRLRQKVHFALPSVANPSLLASANGPCMLARLDRLGEDSRGGGLGGADDVGVDPERDGRVGVPRRAATTWTGTPDSKLVVSGLPTVSNTSS